jgi:putative DNA primase/helicase
LDLIIATAQSRLSKYWKNTNTTWLELIERLKNTTRTSETLSEYKNMTKKEKDSRKDVGGFVGGALKNGRRKADSVINRCLICLDADYAGLDFVDAVRSTLNCEWAIYSTHSHTIERPRLRLIIPLDRAVSPDEYQAISRMVAKTVGIDRFDDSTYEPHRLMYYPSTSYDAEYVFEKNESEFLKADNVLNLYLDWKDAILWPVSSRVDKVRNRDMQKQGDPLEKHGLIGAFCKSYSIQEAISEFLPEVYIGDGERYSFKGGSTTGGVVIYDDKFSFSHHGTDPAGGQLCNAWDLVRIHKFRLLDDEVNDGTPMNRTPSYLKMIDFVNQDKKVKRLLIEQRMVDVKNEFEVIKEEGEELDTKFIEDLETDKKGNLVNTIDSFRIILLNDPLIKDIVALDEFSGRLTLLRDTPWGSKKGIEWSDNDDSSLRFYIEKNYGLYGVKKAEDAFRTVIAEKRYHPVKRYLDGLVWDGIPRIENLFIDYLGAEDNEYVRTVTRKSLCAAVARIINPGTKFDNVVILSGAQGIGKSYILSRLGGTWFNDSINSLQGKEAYEQLQGSWIVELGELKAFKGVSTETIKHFLSKTHDTFRAPYERRTKTHPRQCIFFGTTNSTTFLSDATGDRRSWPIELDKNRITKSVFNELTDDEVGLIWSEAIYLLHKGEKLFLDSRMTEIAMQIQEKHYEESDMAGMVLDFINRKIPDSWDNYSLSERRTYWFNFENGELAEVNLVDRTRIAPIEIWCELLNGDIKSLDRRKSAEIKDILRRMKGWTDLRFKIKLYGTQRGFEKIEL